jgi:GNAT superfamily N-acetyltransferase
VVDSPTNEQQLLERAIEGFARGYAYTRSFTHPYLAERVGPVWVTRDGPRTRGDYRTEEWIAYGIPPAKVDQLAREHTRGRYAICAMRALDDPMAPLRDGYKELGYRLNTTEPLMVHSLQKIPDVESPLEIRRVTTQDEADRLTRAARARQVLPRHLNGDDTLRQYVALDGDLPVGWVRSITVGDATWCSNMNVKPEFRRRGIARALLSRMLRDDRNAGAETAVLLASHAGALLYPAVGYEMIGTLLLFTPVRE